MQYVNVIGRIFIPFCSYVDAKCFTIDWITSSSVFRSVMAEKRDVIFPNHIVSSLRRNRDASIRRINK
ncbi:hypothetical protein SAMN04488518_1393, partial [Pseudovibrio ascidiaceicola]